MEGENKYYHKDSVHKVLAHSYTAYFVLFLIGVSLDLIFKIRILGDHIMVPFGATILLIASFLVFWAQKTSRNLDIENMSTEVFRKGPYAFTRTPTHFGLFFMLLGFGIMINATFVIVSTVISFLLSKFIFLKKQEKILAEKYGSHYTEYKKQVKV